MKQSRTLILAAAMSITLLSQAIAGLAVVDVGLISTNLQNAKRDLIEQIFQEGNQQEMIGQIDTYLEILGDPSKVDLELVNRILHFLRTAGISLETKEIIRDLDADEVFANREGTLFEPVEREITVDGEVVGEIVAEAFKAEVATRRTVEHYRDVRSEVLGRRVEIKQELTEVLARLQAAETDSEVQKLSVVAKALDTQLAALDREVGFAANELSVRWIELQLEEKIQAKARIQKERAAARVATEKDLEFYQLPSSPALFTK